MKTLTLSLTALIAMAVSGPAALILSDSFSYPDGPLVTRPGSPWQTHSGTTGDLQVVSGQIKISVTNSEDVSALLSGQPYGPAGGARLYTCFQITVTNRPSGSGSYFAHFKDDFKQRTTE